MKAMQINTLIEAIKHTTELARIMGCGTETRNYLIKAREFADSAKDSILDDFKTYLHIELQQMDCALSLAARYAEDEQQNGVAAMANDLRKLFLKMGETA